MKKTALLFVASFFACLVTQAQVMFIPKAGVTISSIAFEEDFDDQKSKLGFVFGAGFNLPVIEDFLSIQPELLYIQKGTAYKDDDYKEKATINYLELPVLAKVSFGSEAIKAYVNAGPSIGFGLGGKYKYEEDGEEESGDLKFGDGDDDDFNNRFDLGAQFGGGIGFQAGPGSLLLDLRYGLGFSNLYKTEDGFDKDDAKSKHRVFAITLGYAIPFGGK